MSTARTVEQTFTDEFFDYLEREIKQNQNILMSGSPETYAEYTRKVGEIQALQRVIEEYNTLFKAFFNFNREGN